MRGLLPLMLGSLLDDMPPCALTDTAWIVASVVLPESHTMACSQSWRCPRAVEGESLGMYLLKVGMRLIKVEMDREDESPSRRGSPEAGFGKTYHEYMMAKYSL